MVVHQDSLWNWRTQQLGNGLFSEKALSQAAQTRRVKNYKDLYGNLDNELKRYLPEKILNKKLYLIVVVTFSVFVWLFARLNAI